MIFPNFSYCLPMKTKLAIFVCLVLAYHTIDALICYGTDGTDMNNVNCTNPNAVCFNATLNEDKEKPGVERITLRGCGYCPAPTDWDYKMYNTCRECNTDLCNVPLQCYNFNGTFGADRVNETERCGPNIASCFVEKHFETGYSRGCGHCSDRINEVFKKRYDLPEHSRPSVARAESVEYSCLDCNNGLCNDDKLEPKLLERKYCYAGAARTDDGTFTKEECYLHHNDFYCFKKEVEGLVYKGCGACEPFMDLKPNPIKKMDKDLMDKPSKKSDEKLEDKTYLLQRKCHVCEEDLCNGAIGGLMPAMGGVWLLLLRVGVPVMLLLVPSMVSPFDGA